VSDPWTRDWSAAAPQDAEPDFARAFRQGQQESAPKPWERDWNAPPPTATPPQPQQPKPRTWGDTIYDAMGWDDAKTPAQNFFDPQGIGVAVDRARNVFGSGPMADPNYRGRNPDGSLITAEQAARTQTTISAPSARSDAQRFMDSAAAMAEHYSPGALAARGIAGLIPSADTYSGIPGADNSRATQRDRARALTTESERDWRELEAMRDAADPIIREGDSWYSPGSLRRGAAMLGGGAAGGLISDPTQLIAPGQSWFTRILGQAAIGGGVDAATQGGELVEGVRDRYDPVQTGISAAGGAAVVGGVEAAGALRRWYAGRGINVDTVPDEDLISGAFDGVDPAALTPALPGREPQLLLTDQRPGAAPIALPDGNVMRLPAPAPRLADMRGDIGPAANSNRVPPTGRENGAVTPEVIEGAPDRAAIERNTSAMEQLSALLRGETQPSPRAQLMGSAGGERGPEAVWRRIAERGNAANDLDLPAVPDRAADVPLASPAPAGIGSRSRMVDITRQTESGGRRFAADGSVLTSPKGARGEMQVMPATARDPGYGVRPSNGTLDDDARVGRELLAAYTDHFGGDPAKGWAAYNGGIGRVESMIRQHGDDWLAHMPAETRAYVDKNMRALGGDAPRVAGDSASPAPVTIEQPRATAPTAEPELRSALDDPLAQPVARADDPGQVDQSAAVAQMVELPSRKGPVEGSSPSGSTISEPIAPARQAAPEDALSFLARNGGIADNEGHALRTGRDLPQFAAKGGHVFRKNGMSIDRAGELLHEAGFFPGERPSTSQVLDLIERSATEPQFRPGDEVNWREYRAGVERAEDYGRVRDDMEAAASDAGGEPLGQYEAHRALREIGDTGETPENALTRVREMEQAERQNPGATLYNRARAEGLGRDRTTARLSDELGGYGEHPNPAVRGLARHLQGLVGDAEVRFGEDLGAGIRGAAEVSGDGKVSATVRARDDVETVLHEAIHVATLSRYGEIKGRATEGAAVDPQVRALDELRARAQKAFDRRPEADTQIAHALSSTDEFLAAGLTSPRFQEFLKKHSTAGLWGRFTDWVRGLLGLNPRQTRLLDDVLAHGAEMIRRMDQDPVRPAGGTVLFSRDGGSTDKSWGKIADLVFDPEFRNGDSAAMAAGIKRVVGDPKGTLSGISDRLRGFGEATVYSTDSALRSLGARFNAPTLGKLADIFHAEAGVTSRATDRTFGEAVTRNQARFETRLDSALEAHRSNDAAMGRIRDLLAQPNKTLRATAAERKAAAEVRDLLAEVLEYRRDAGEAIGEVKDGYFPRMMRQDRVFAEPDKFLKAAEAAYREIGADDPAKAAAAYLQRNIDGHLGIEDGVGAGSPGASTAKSREFGKAADEHLRDFYDTNPLSALTTYISGAVKRAEESRRFGIKGRENSPERLAWVKEHGDQTQWAVMKDDIQAELRENGQREPGLMDRIEALRSNSLGRARMGSPRTGAVVSTIHAWNQLRTLGRAVVSSIPELSMGFVRAGPRLGFTHLNTTLGEFVRNVRKMPLSDAARYAEAAGAIGSDNSLHLLRARADDVTANATAGKVLDQFYRKNGLHAWTRAGRTAAVKTGQRFLDVLAGDMESAAPRVRNRAAGYLRELGVRDPEAFAAALRSDTPSLTDLAGDSGVSAEYATALLRFANQTVLMPTRSVKPSWASHPLGSLVFALQSYNYAFKKNVLDRVGRETVAGIKERDPAKLAAASGLVALVGTTAAVQGLRHAIWGSPVSAEEQTPLHYALETMDRSGLFGAASPIFNAFAGLRYQRSVGQALQGSVLGAASDAADAAGGLVTNNNPDTNTAERKAAAAFYDMAVGPVESAIGASLLRGPLGSAVILGRGVRNDNGLLPSDRGAIVDALAGEKGDEK
jgi:hypothetical protein